MNIGNKKYFTNQILTLNNDLSFYLLGLYMTDGCIETKNNKPFRFIITSKDKELLIKIKHILCPMAPITKSSNCYQFRLCDSKSIEWLISYGCTPRKSLSIKIRKNIPKKYIPDFIRGCIDGDGSISIYKRKRKISSSNALDVYLCSASMSFIKQISKLIPKNINYNIGTYKNIGSWNKPGIINKIVFTDAHAYELLKWIYYPEHKISLKRKNIMVRRASKIKLSTKRK